MRLTCLFVAATGGASSSEPNFDLLAKIEEDYVPTSQPVAYSCTIRSKIHDTDSWTTPVLVSHNEDFRLWDALEIETPDLLASRLRSNSKVHDCQGGQRVEFSNSQEKLHDIRLDRHHLRLSAVVDLGNRHWTGFEDFVPVNEASNTWLDTFVVETYRLNRDGSTGENLGSTDKNKPVASWTCERERVQHDNIIQERPQGRNIASPLHMNETAVYEVVFRNSWTEQSHPFQYPENALFGDQMVVVHSSDFMLFRPGRMVTEGFEDFAEEGDAALLEEELSDAETEGSVARWSRKRGRDLGFVVLDSKYDFVSTATRLSPSPDWFTGLSKVRPIGQDGFWIPSFSVDVYPLDAGTKAGFLYTDSEDQSSSNPVTRMTAATISPDFPVFLKTDDGGNPSMLPIGKYEFFLSETSVPTSSPAPSAVDETTRPTDEPTTDLQLQLPYLSQVATSDAVYYEVTFEREWSRLYHPYDYPDEAEFGVHTILSHSKDFSLWKPGEFASDSMQELLVGGSSAPLMEDLDDAGAEIGEAIQGSGSILGYLKMDRNHKRISSVCRLNPSPDWFLGLIDVAPHAAGFWVEEFSIDMVPFDAGLVEGKTYTDTGPMSVPQQAIARLDADSIDPESPVFVNKENGVSVVLPIGRYIFRLTGSPAPSSTRYPTQAPTVSNTPTASSSSPSSQVGSNDASRMPTPTPRAPSSLPTGPLTSPDGSESSRSPTSRTPSFSPTGLSLDGSESSGTPTLMPTHQSSESFWPSAPPVSDTALPTSLHSQTPSVVPSMSPTDSMLPTVSSAPSASNAPSSKPSFTPEPSFSIMPSWNPSSSFGPSQVPTYASSSSPSETPSTFFIGTQSPTSEEGWLHFPTGSPVPTSTGDSRSPSSIPEVTFSSSPTRDPIPSSSAYPTSASVDSIPEGTFSSSPTRDPTPSASTYPTSAPVELGEISRAPSSSTMAPSTTASPSSPSVSVSPSESTTPSGDNSQEPATITGGFTIEIDSNTSIGDAFIAGLQSSDEDDETSDGEEVDPPVAATEAAEVEDENTIADDFLSGRDEEDTEGGENEEMEEEESEQTEPSASPAPSLTSSSLIRGGGIPATLSATTQRPSAAPDSGVWIASLLCLLPVLIYLS